MLLPWQPKNHKLTKHECGWFYQNTITVIIFFTKSETMVETLLWEIAAWLKRARGSYLPHPLLMQDKYIVAI